MYSLACRDFLSLSFIQKPGVFEFLQLTKLMLLDKPTVVFDLPELQTKVKIIAGKILPKR